MISALNRLPQRLLAGTAAAAFVLCLSSGAFGQAIERNLPPPAAPGPSVILTPETAQSDRDARPLGPTVRSIVVLGPDEPVIAGDLAPGVDPGQSTRLSRPSAKAQLGRFLGKPLSRKLISDIRNAIALEYRRQGYPLVSVSTPVQNISRGVLQVRVIEFVLGKKIAPGAKNPNYVERQVRAASGQTVNANQLSEDLDWLNRYPFRKTQAIFNAGDALGQTNLILQTTEAKPWSVYAGYSNTGSPLTGFDRYFAGFTVAAPYLQDAYASYQFTGSDDSLFSEGRPFDTAAQPRYVSHAGRLVIPTLARQDLEVTLDFVQSYQPIASTNGDFLSRQTTYEATVGYRSALSNLVPVFDGDVVAGIELKRQAGKTFFGTAAVASTELDVLQLYAQYATQVSESFGRTALDMTVHVSPGAADSRDTKSAYLTATNGEAESDRYAYVVADLTQTFQLPKAFVYSFSATGQYAPNALPLTERIGLGGSTLVRGYTLDDGVFDSALLSRNEVRSPVTPVLGLFNAKWFPDQASPFIFLDAGYGKNEFAHTAGTFAGTGVGSDYQFGTHFSANLTASWALTSEGLTHAGDFLLQTKATLTF